MSYKLKGALRIGHNDTQFHWTYLGKGWDVKTKKLTIEQNFEDELQKNDIWYKATGLGKDRLQTTFNRGTITLEAENISKNSRIRMLSQRRKFRKKKNTPPLKILTRNLDARLLDPV